MPKGEAPEQSIIQRVGTIRGSDKDEVVAEPVKFLHQGNCHTVHLRDIVFAATPRPDSINLIEAENARTFSRVIEYQTDMLLCLAQTGINQTGKSCTRTASPAYEQYTAPTPSFRFRVHP